MLLPALIKPMFDAQAAGKRRSTLPRTTHGGWRYLPVPAHAHRIVVVNGKTPPGVAGVMLGA